MHERIAQAKAIRKAREAVKIPETYAAPKAALMVSPDDVEDAFVKANPGLSRAGVAVTCGGTEACPAGGFGGDGGPASHASLSGPAQAAFDSNGNLFVADGGNK